MTTSDACKRCDAVGPEECEIHGDGTSAIELSVSEEARRLAGAYLTKAADAMADQAERAKRGAYNAQPHISKAKFEQQLNLVSAFTCAEMHIREDVRELTGVKPLPKRRPPVVEPAGLFEVAS